MRDNWRDHRRERSLQLQRRPLSSGSLDCSERLLVEESCACILSSEPAPSHDWEADSTSFEMSSQSRVAWNGSARISNAGPVVSRDVYGGPLAFGEGMDDDASPTRSVGGKRVRSDAKSTRGKRAQRVAHLLTERLERRCGRCVPRRSRATRRELGRRITPPFES
jgi:hypothetical protein